MELMEESDREKILPEKVTCKQDNSNARDTALYIVKAVTQEILIQMRAELNDNLVKLKQWVKEELADNTKSTRLATDLEGNLENSKNWIKLEHVENMVHVERDGIAAPTTLHKPRHDQYFRKKPKLSDIDIDKQLAEGRPRDDIFCNSFGVPETLNRLVSEIQRCNESIGQIRDEFKFFRNDSQESLQGNSPRWKRSSSRHSTGLARNDSFTISDDQRKVDFFDAIVFEPEAQLLVDQQIPPNMNLGEVTINGKQFHSCSVLAAAVLSNQIENAELLLKSGANPDSVYGFHAGKLRMNWSAPCAAATIAKNDERMLRLLLQYRANPAARASNDATLIWQCCYFGKDQMLRVLLDLVECDLSHLTHPAKSQNAEGVTFSPLHISIIMGYQNCSRLLIEAGHPPDAPNEHNETPLDAAIRLCHPELVTLLIKNGAKWRARTRRDSQGTEANAERNEDLPNPVMAYAVVSGLQSQHQQVRDLPREELLRLVQIGTKAMMAMLDSLFVKREIRSKGDLGEIDVRKLAVVRRTEVRNLDQSVYRFPVVVSSNVAFEEMQELLKKGELPSPRMLKFIEEITPQVRKYSCSKRARETIFQIDHQLTPVDVYECIVPKLHHDLFFLKALADADRFDAIFTNQHCQAMITYSWGKAYNYVLRQFADQLCISMFLVFLALQINFHPDHYFNLDFRDHVRLVAALTLPFWLDTFFAELCLLAAYVKHGWAWNYILSLSKFLYLVQVFADGAVLLRLAFNGIHAAEDFLFSCFLAAVCLFKWARMIDCLTPFRPIGLPVMPILYTLSDLGPSMGVTIMYFAGMAHAIISMDLASSHFIPQTFQAFLFGFSGDFGTVQALSDPAETGFENWMLRFFLCIATLIFPVTLMNLLIAAMSNSYSEGITNVEKLYQKRCAERAFSRSCVRWIGKSIRRRICNGKDPTSSAKHLWYCREHDDCEELQS